MAHVRHLSKMQNSVPVLYYVLLRTIG